MGKAKHGCVLLSTWSQLYYLSVTSVVTHVSTLKFSLLGTPVYMPQPLYI